MAAVDCSKTPRSKSIKARALTLRGYEARKLAQDGRVLIVREVKLVQFGPSDTPGYDWNFRRGPGGVWEDYRTAGLLASKYCPLGPVGSPLWGREAWSPDHAAFYPHYPHVYKADGYPASYEIENGRIYGDEHREWFRFRWQSSTSMPRHASRFPRLRHESCEVKRAGELTWDELTATGMPPLPDAIIGAFPGPAEYAEAATVDPAAGPLMPPSGAWLWCSLVVDLDRLEVADA